MRAGEHLPARVVKSTKSANRMVASGKLSAIAMSPSRMRLTIVPGRMFSSSASVLPFSTATRR